MKLNEKLALVQSELKAPKSQYNSFGKYHYRSCEDIVESVKPILLKYQLSLVIKDEMVMLGERFYVKAIAVLSDGEESVETMAYAREPKELKGMTDCQVTGATSSYARKYALNGLFAIDDTKDTDSEEYQEVKIKNDEMLEKVKKEALEVGVSLEKLATYLKKDSVNDLTIDELKNAISKKKERLENAKVQ